MPIIKCNSDFNVQENVTLPEMTVQLTSDSQEPLFLSLLSLKEENGALKLEVITGSNYFFKNFPTEEEFLCYVNKNRGKVLSLEIFRKDTVRSISTDVIVIDLKQISKHTFLVEFKDLTLSANPASL